MDLSVQNVNQMVLSDFERLQSTTAIWLVLINFNMSVITVHSLQTNLVVSENTAPSTINFQTIFLNINVTYVHLTLEPGSQSRLSADIENNITEPATFMLNKHYH